MNKPLRTGLALTVALGLIAFGAVSATAGSKGKYQQEKMVMNKTVAMWNTGDVENVDELVHEKCVVYNPAYPEPFKGIQEHVDWLKDTRRAFPDWQLTVEESFVADNRFAIKYRASGTNTGSFMENPPTGKTIQHTGVAIIHLKEGKVAKLVLYTDPLEIPRQLGLLADPAQQSGEEYGGK